MLKVRVFSQQKGNHYQINNRYGLVIFEQCGIQSQYNMFTARLSDSHPLAQDKVTLLVSFVLAKCAAFDELEACHGQAQARIGLEGTSPWP